MVSFSPACFAFYHLHRSSIGYFAAHPDIIDMHTHTYYSLSMRHLNFASSRITPQLPPPANWQHFFILTEEDHNNQTDISYRESHIADAVFGPFAERRTVFYHNTTIQTKEQNNKNLFSFAENVYIQNKTRTFGLCSVDSLPALAVRHYRTLNSDASHLCNDGGMARKS